MTNLLVLTSNGKKEDFQDYFEEVVHSSLADARITTSGDETVVRAGGRTVEEFDAAYLSPSPQTAIYARVLLDTVHEDVNTNLEPSAFTIMMEKHYLFKVLSERKVPVPKTIALSTEKGLTNAEQSIEFPVVASVFEGFERESVDRVKDIDQLSAIAERLEHGENLMLVQESVEGELYDTLYVDGHTVSMRIESGGWMVNDDSTMNYHSLPGDQEDAVQEAASAIGGNICRVQTRGGTVINVESNPELERFQDISGKNVYGKVADLLKGGEKN